ncbi:NAD(P)H-dependent amine dehydrogenase family protein [Scatolibacter rhodanostii]|uniref:NAD(P)H-dependent amine dehydrogenase family protein n=1 Tax=Scatolibacter rhodanostii TaxID=2014781 RepID=UPI000C06BCB9|nr:dihydrodipicolinate reductase [Scatolibacter rhodanostii]
MDRKVRAIQYGCGKMSVYLIRYMMEKDVEIVAAFDASPAVIGKDIGEIIGGEKVGILVSDSKEADTMMANLQADVCVVATLSTMADIKDAFAVCAKNGINAISTCEESLYPWNSSPAITEELDKLAKENGVTLAGSGYPDMFWGVLIDTLSGSMQTLTKIKGFSSYNVEDYGIALAKGHGAGLSSEEFEQEIGKYNSLSSDEQQKLVENGEYVPSYMWNQNGWLCSKMGLTVVSQVQKCVPTTHTEDIHSSTLNMTVKAGQPTGMSAVVTTETKEGITLETECVGKVYAPDEFDRNDWTFFGEPETTINVNRPATVQLTCANLVNRIPALIAAAPGYVSTDKMPNNVYLSQPMNEYIK